MMLERTFPWPIDESFQRPVSELMMSLHRFFRGYTRDAMDLDLGWCPEAGEVYDRFLGLLDDAINDLGIYEPVAPPGPRPALTSFQRVMSPTKNVIGDKAVLHHGNSKKKRMRTPLPRSSKRMKLENR